MHLGGVIVHSSMVDKAVQIFEMYYINNVKTVSATVLATNSLSRQTNDCQCQTNPCLSYLACTIIYLIYEVYTTQFNHPLYTADSPFSFNEINRKVLTESVALASDAVLVHVVVSRIRSSCSPCCSSLKISSLA